MKKIIGFIAGMTLLFSIQAQVVTRDIFTLTLNPTPPLTDRIVIGDGLGGLAENMTLQQFIDFTTSNLNVYTQTEVDNLFLNYLAKDNLTVYTPTQQYHPATKEYVDGNYSNVSWTSSITPGTNVTILYARVAQRNGFVTVTARYKITAGPAAAGKIIMTLPGSIATSTVTQEFGAINADSPNNEGRQLYIQNTERNIRIRDNVAGADLNYEYSLHITYPLF